MTTDPNTESSIDLSAEEQAAIDEQANETAEAARLAAEPEPVPAAEPEPAPPAPDPVLTALAENTAATRALAESVAARQTQPEPQPPAEPEPAPRDFDAEYAALQQQFDDGDLDAAEHARALRKLTLDEAEARTAAQIAKANTEAAEAARKAAEEAAAQARAEADAAFNTAQAAFFTDPGNAALIDNNIKRAAFQAAVQEAYAEAPAAGPDAWLVAAREKITGIAAVDVDKKLRDAAFARSQQAGQPAVTLRDVPNAGSPGSEPGASLDNLPIDKLEDALAAMSDADRNKYLAGAPGNVAVAA